mmetsp:Transcript_65644/g.201133  ORF Transcript_65644/g.201133 Transcript_65644/m.201133 type:complete len:282 (+) Transcript_65644:510-1355(+)
MLAALVHSGCGDRNARARTRRPGIRQWHAGAAQLRARHGLHGAGVLSCAVEAAARCEPFPRTKPMVSGPSVGGDGFVLGVAYRRRVLRPQRPVAGRRLVRRSHQSVGCIQDLAASERGRAGPMPAGGPCWLDGVRVGHCLVRFPSIGAPRYHQPALVGHVEILSALHGRRVDVVVGDSAELARSGFSRSHALRGPRANHSRIVFSTRLRGDAGGDWLCARVSMGRYGVGVVLECVRRRRSHRGTVLDAVASADRLRPLAAADALRLPQGHRGVQVILEWIH